MTTEFSNDAQFLHDTCTCGRSLDSPHCPACGSRQCYTLMSRKDIVNRPDGTVVRLCIHKCRRCGNQYNDDDTMFRCHARPERLGRPTLQESENTRQNRNIVFNPHVPRMQPDMLMAAAESLKQRGIIA